MDPRKKDNKKYKLILSQTDKDTLIALIDKSKVNFPKDYSLRVKTNYEFFKKKLAENIDELETFITSADLHISIAVLIIVFSLAFANL